MTAHPRRKPRRIPQTVVMQLGQCLLRDREQIARSATHATDYARSVSQELRCEIGAETVLRLAKVAGVEFAIPAARARNAQQAAPNGPTRAEFVTLCRAVHFLLQDRRKGWPPGFRELMTDLSIETSPLFGVVDAAEADHA